MLTHWGQVVQICISKAGHHWFRKWLVVCPVPSHYLNQWNISVISLVRKIDAKWECKMLEDSTISDRACHNGGHHWNYNTGALGVVSLTFRELSKIISRKYTLPVITFLVRISSWNFVHVPKAWLWAHDFCNTQIFERMFWRAHRTLVKQPPGSQQLIWRFSICRWNLRVPDPQMSFRDYMRGYQDSSSSNGPLTRYENCGLRMRRECQERFPRHWLQRKPLVSDPGMHHGTCVTHVPWCMSGSLTRGGGENAPGIPGACATRNSAYLVRGPWLPGNMPHYSVCETNVKPLVEVAPNPKA